jgi:hypothetical protein
MPVSASDIKIYYSGGASKATPDGNQGGAISSIAVFDQDLTIPILTTETMWKNVTYDERVNGVKKYHCFYLKNNNATNTATAIKLYIDADTTGPDKIKLGYAGTVPNTLEQTLGGSSIQAKYDVALNSSEARMDNDRTRAGQSVDSSRAGLYNVAPVQIDAYLIKHGNPSDATPVKCFVRSFFADADTSSATRSDFGQVAASSIPTTSTVTTFINTSNTYKLRLDDIIWFEYKSGTLNDYIAVNRSPTDPVAYSHQVNYDGQQIRNVPDFDLSMKVSTAISTGGVDTTPPVGVTFSTPSTRDNAIALPDLAPGAFVGFWVQLEVPVRSAYYLKDKSEITIEWNS